MTDKQIKKTAHIVSHTHWDREWRYPIWQTRAMLLDFMDELVELLEKGDYPGFLLDGQVIPAIDYLDMRPEKTEAVKSLVKAGKLEIGPWYILPDEFPLDGESLVRNLLVGTRKAKQLGGGIRIGYTPFGWGQTAQLPQIYAGFGIDVALIGKKVSKDRAPDSEFAWIAPDGSRLLSSRFGDIGRQNFYFMVHLHSLFGRSNFSNEEWKYDITTDGVAYHRADRDYMEQDHFRLDAPADWHPEIITSQLLDETWKTTDQSVLESDRLMMNGCDYTAAQPLFPEMLERIRKVDTDSQRQWIHTTMAEFVKLIREKIDVSKLKEVHGELRDGPIQDVTGNALATRANIKQKNKKAEQMLFRLAEPLSFISSVAGRPCHECMLERSLDYLLKSQPHDSINGVTQDKTAEDTLYRLDQSIELSNTVAEQAMGNIVKDIDLSGYDKDSVMLVVFNSLPDSRRDVVEAWVNLPAKPDKDVFCDMEGVIVYDADDNPVPMQWNGWEDEKYCVAELHTRAFPYYCDRHRIYFDTGEIPAGGYKVFRVCHRDQADAADLGKSDWSDSQCQTGTLLTGPDSMENEYLRIEMNSNGTFDMTCKQTGEVYKKLNYFEDRGEQGNYWVNERPMHDQVHTSLGSNARIWSQDSGPVQATLVSEVAMSLPTKGIPQQKRRGDELKDLLIRSYITLKKGQKHVEVTVELDNCHQDHYLRAMFPTGLTGAEYADAGGHFIVDRRPVKPLGPSPSVEWRDMATQPHNRFVDISDGKNGFALINQGLSEYELTNTKDRVLALSLFRSVKNWICTERAGSDFPSQKGGQLPGSHKYKYAIMPHKGTWQDAGILKLSEMFNNPVIPIQTNASAGMLDSKEKSFFSINNPNLGFSAFKRAEDSSSYILRVYNPADTLEQAVLNVPGGIRGAWLVNLDEQRLEEIPLKEGKMVAFNAPAYKIVSIEIAL
jgi:mannosylglycerate hydrolase